MTKTKILIFFMLFLVIILPARAFSASVQIQTQDTQNVYFKDFDVAVLDFIITAEQQDVLDALSVNKSGTAREGIEFTDLTLWADVGDEGFQGYGYDENLGNAQKDNGKWVFNEIDYGFNNSQRFFVSLRSGDLIQNKIIQFLLENANDINNNGEWESGESGIFLRSGVIFDSPVSATSGTISFKSNKVDVLGPKAALNNISVDVDNPTVLSSSEGKIVFTGIAQDRNGDDIKSVELEINGQTVNAVSTGADLSTWQAEYYPTQAFLNTTIKITAKDPQDRVWTSGGYYIQIDDRDVSIDNSSLISDKYQVLDDDRENAVITAELRDQDDSLLSDRTVQFIASMEGEELFDLTTSTDSNGQAEIIKSFAQAGIVQVKALFESTMIDNIYISVIEEVDDEINEEDENFSKEINDGDLIKIKSNSAVYYFYGDKRYPFINQPIYESWYADDYSNVKVVLDEVMASIPLGRPVNFRPGEMITSPSVKEVYAVDSDGTLRHIINEDIAAQLYGNNWNKKVHDMQESLLFSYTIGEPIARAADYDLYSILNQPLAISDEIG